MDRRANDSIMQIGNRCHSGMMKTFNPRHLSARHNLRFISMGFAVTKMRNLEFRGGDAHVRWDAPREAESGWPARSIPLEYCVCHRLQLCGTSAGSSDWRTVWASFDSSFGRYRRGCD